MSQTIRKRYSNLQKTSAKDSKAMLAEIPKKEQKCYKVLILFFGLIVVLGFIAYFASPIQAVVVEDINSIDCEGIFSLNENLTHSGTRISLYGPESIAEDANKNMYTGLLNGAILKLYPEKGISGNGKVEIIANVVFNDFTTMNWKHGRPLGIRVRNDVLYCADAVYGIYSINLTTKKIERLVKPCDVDPCMRFPDDLDITSDGKFIYFSDLSAHFAYDDMAYEILQGTSSGRVFQYSFRTKTLKKVIDNLGSANGVQLTENEQMLIVAETSRYRVSWFDVNTWKKRYVQNLPAMPDNVRKTSKGSYLVAMSAPPFPGNDLLLRWPSLRQIIAVFPKSVLLKLPNRHHNIVVEVDGKGKVLRTLHDTQGKQTFALAQATELSDGRLALSSYVAEFLSFVEV